MDPIIQDTLNQLPRLTPKLLSDSLFSSSLFEDLHRLLPGHSILCCLSSLEVLINKMLLLHCISPPLVKVFVRPPTVVAHFHFPIHVHQFQVGMFHQELVDRHSLSLQILLKDFQIVSPLKVFF